MVEGAWLVYINRGLLLLQWRRRERRITLAAPVVFLLSLQDIANSDFQAANFVIQ